MPAESCPRSRTVGATGGARLNRGAATAAGFLLRERHCGRRRMARRRTGRRLSRTASRRSRRACGASSSTTRPADGTGVDAPDDTTVDAAERQPRLRGRGQRRARRARSRTARRTPCCSTTTCSSSRAASRRSSRRPGRAVPPRRASTGPPGFAFAGGELELAARLRAARRRRRRLSQRRLPVHLAERLGARRTVQRGALPVLRGRRVVPACACARRAADGRARRARDAQRRRVERRARRARPGRTTRRATGSGCSSSSAAPAWRVARRCHERMRARMRAVQSARRAVARAKLAGVRDWSAAIAWGGARGPAEGRLRRRLPHADARRHGASRDRPARRAAGARTTSS